MANPSLTLDGVTYVLPDGRTLFSDLNAHFDVTPTALVGRNGVGKSVLAALLAGHLAPTHGVCRRRARAFYLGQSIGFQPTATVADLAGVQPILAALTRIESGQGTACDFDTVGHHWDIRQRLGEQLARHRLDHLTPDRALATLSGGEVMRVALLRAWLSAADFLILDEPTNHLDRDSRRALLASLREWPGGRLIVSHDRALLDEMAQIVELTPAGLSLFSGGFTDFMACRDQRNAHAMQALARCKQDRRRVELALQERRERQARRLARGANQRRDANQSKIVLDRQQVRAETSTGKLEVDLRARQALQATKVRLAAQAIDRAPTIAMTVGGAPDAAAKSRHALRLEAVQLPHLPKACCRIDLHVMAGERIALTGANGAGKSTLLRVMAGQLAPLSGRIERPPGLAYLDQSTMDLDPQRPVLELLRKANQSAGEAWLRTRLALLDLDAAKITRPSGALSGGERLKAALACVLYADPPARVLLLDEANNHLDLAALSALEALLGQFTGTLLVASHDERFLAAIAPTARLHVDATGWRKSDWATD